MHEGHTPYLTSATRPTSVCARQAEVQVKNFVLLTSAVANSNQTLFLALVRSGFQTAATQVRQWPMQCSARQHSAINCLVATKQTSSKRSGLSCDGIPCRSCRARTRAAGFWRRSAARQRGCSCRQARRRPPRPPSRRRLPTPTASPTLRPARRPSRPYRTWFKPRCGLQARKLLVQPRQIPTGCPSRMSAVPCPCTSCRSDCMQPYFHVRAVFRAQQVAGYVAALNNGSIQPQQFAALTSPAALSAAVASTALPGSLNVTVPASPLGGNPGALPPPAAAPQPASSPALAAPAPGSGPAPVPGAASSPAAGPAQQLGQPPPPPQPVASQSGPSPTAGESTHPLNKLRITEQITRGLTCCDLLTMKPHACMLPMLA